MAPFNQPALTDSFCTTRSTAYPLRSVLDGTVFLVDLPLAQWGIGGKVAYTFIKLRFFNIMQQRRNQSHWNQTRPVFLMGDEYQEIVSASRDGLSDLNFWDKSRSSGTIGILSAQSLSSFYAAIGDRDIANALIQNFRQKICFATEDATTMNELNQWLGRTERDRWSYQHQQGRQEVPKQLSSTQSQSASQSLAYMDQPLIHAQRIRQLQPNQAIALLTLEGRHADDVLELTPIWLPTPPSQFNVSGISTDKAEPCKTQNQIK